MSTTMKLQEYLFNSSRAFTKWPGVKVGTLSAAGVASNAQKRSKASVPYSKASTLGFVIEKMLDGQISICNISQQPSIYMEYRHKIGEVTQSILTAVGNSFTIFSPTDISYYEIIAAIYMGLVYNPEMGKWYNQGDISDLITYANNAAVTNNMFLSCDTFYYGIVLTNKEDLSITILIDQSGSMRRNMHRVQETCALIMEALKKFDIPIKLIGFFSNGATPIYLHYNEWQNTAEVRKSIVSMKTSGGTFLGHAIRYAGVFLKKRPEKHKIFIVITDGQPESSLYRDRNHAMNDCRYAVADISKFADVLGIGLFSSEEDQKKFRFIFRENSISMNNTETLIKDLPKMIGNLIKNY